MQTRLKDDVELARAAIQIEQQFAENHYHGSERNPAILVVSGSSPIVLSCPHAVNHTRAGKIKLADTFTGALGIQLASLTQSHALIYARTTSEDPNYDAKGVYKQQLKELIAKTDAQFVLDLHGMAKARSEELVIGTGLGKTLGEQQHKLLPIFSETFKRAGFTKIVADDPQLFNASMENTITSFTWRVLKVPVMQIEINKVYRDPQDLPDNYAKTIDALEHIVTSIKDYYHKRDRV